MAALIHSYPCGIHNITYLAPKPGCPLCDAQREITQLRESIKEVANENRLLHERLGTLQAISDPVMAYRSASALLDDNDRSFFKEVLYLFRDRASVSLRPLLEERILKESGRRKTVRMPTGIIVVPRQGNAWAHECTSIGGAAIATTFAQAKNSAGAIDATKMMVRGLSDLLPGKA